MSVSVHEICQILLEESIMKKPYRNIYFGQCLASGVKSGRGMKLILENLSVASRSIVSNRSRCLIRNDRSGSSTPHIRIKITSLTMLSVSSVRRKTTLNSLNFVL